MQRLPQSVTVLLTACLTLGLPPLLALDPHKTITQYRRTVWTQADGLPQDTIRRITQTADGYLWLATEEGLTRFDGYDFVTFTRNNSSMLSTSITALTAGLDGTLWVGTSNGLVRYRDGQFTTFTRENGLPDNVITSLFEDHEGTLWIAAGIYLSSLKANKFTNYSPERLLPIQAVRVIYEDPQHQIWICGVGGLVRFDNRDFVPMLGSRELDGNIVFDMGSDRDHNLWISGTKGLISRSPSGRLRRFDVRNGLPDNLVRAFWIDRAGNVWVGTNDKLSRLEGDRFVSSGLAGGNEEDWIRCLFEDREGDFWIGMTSGLNRLRDGQFTVYSRNEGLPSNEPTTVHQDQTGDIWVGYHGKGLVAIHDGRFRMYTTRDGLPTNGIFAIRESRDGGLLLSTREGLSWVHGGKFTNYVLPDPLARPGVLDALEDRHRQIWVAGPGGVYLMTGNTFRNIIRGGPLVNASAVALSESPDGSIWAGTYGDGLWQIKDGKIRQFTTADGLGSNRIRNLRPDRDGALWIGTFGGGLNVFRKGVFFQYGAKDGLLSDNVAHVEDDGNGSLWLSTPRGICRVSKQQLLDFAAGRVKVLSPVNYGSEDGLPSAQSAPGYPVGGGGARTRDGRLWFTTTRGLAVFDPKDDIHVQASPTPTVQLLDATADGRTIDLRHAAQLKPGTSHVQFRYTGIHLSAPERVNYSYIMEGLDRDWIAGGVRRVIDYNGLRHGSYRFRVRATVPGQSSGEASFGLEVLPHFYETQYFLWLCVGSCVAAIYGLYQLRLQRIRSRFSLVLEERARMAREIHDTLAQGFVGISRQLDALARRINGVDRIAEQHLKMAQKMVRHSLKEARQSVMDLRASALEDGDFLAALTAATRHWTAAKAIPVEIEVDGTLRKLPDDVSHNLLRIAQEAVINALTHSDASKISIHVGMGAEKLLLTVNDNGRGFELSGAFKTAGGHFGLLGMRERAERLGGELALSSEPGAGTRVGVSVPMSSETLDPGLRSRAQSNLMNIVKGHATS